MPQFPAGTVTFLFTDIEQSTRGWERDAVAARIAVERHHALIHQSVETYGGVRFKIVGDATQSAFPTAPQGVAAAVVAQRALLDEPWPDVEQRPRVRMALHAGTAEPRDGDYLAACLNRLARLLDAAHGEQRHADGGQQTPHRVLLSARDRVRSGRDRSKPSVESNRSMTVIDCAGNTAAFASGNPGRESII